MEPKRLRCDCCTVKLRLIGGKSLVTFKDGVEMLMCGHCAPRNRADGCKVRYLTRPVYEIDTAAIAAMNGEEYRHE